MTSSFQPANKTKNLGLLLFFLAGILACCSVWHWLLMAFVPDTMHRHVFHMISSAQGFLSCLVAAFCLSSRQNKWLPVLAGIAALGVVVTAWLRYLTPYEIMLGISQGCWLILALLIFFITYPKLFKEKKLPPPSYIWFPMALFFGIAGAILVSTYSSVIILTDEKVMWLVLLGRGYLLQAMMLAVLLGVAPHLYKWTGNSAPNSDGLEQYGGSLFHLLGCIFLMLSFPMELWMSHIAGYGLRALLTFWGIVYLGGFLKFPNTKSFLTWCIWLAAWLIPLGYCIVALTPALRLAGLHMVFIGGFTLGPLAFALEWLVGKNRNLKKDIDRPLPMALFAMPLIFSLVLRCIPETSVFTRFFSWGLSTSLFIFGILVWLILINKIVGLQKR